jgi:hypothetical protein
MMNRQQFLIGLAAGTGGIAPNLVNLAQGFIGQTPNTPGALYYVGVAIFFILGAIVALIFAETDHRKAFFLGVSLPAFIAAAQTQSKAPQPELKAQVSIADFFPSARAQSQDIAPSPRLVTQKSSPQHLNLKSKSDCIQCELWFMDDNGSLLEKKYIADLSATTMVILPSGATQFAVGNYKINPTVVKLPKDVDSPITIEFATKYNAWNDLKRGLGNYGIRPYDAQLKTIVVPPTASP